MSDAEREPEVELDPVVEALHDAIDEQESVAVEAKDIVAETRSKLIELVGELGDTTAALEAVALLVEDELDSLTTRAVKQGYAGARKRAAKLRGRS